MEVTKTIYHCTIKKTKNFQVVEVSEGFEITNTKHKPTDPTVIEHYKTALQAKVMDTAQKLLNKITTPPKPTTNILDEVLQK